MRKFYLYLIPLVLVAFLVIFNNSIQNLALSLFEKPIVIVSGVSSEIKILVNSIINYRTIIDENIALREGMNSLISKNRNLESLKKENDELRKQLNISSFKKMRVEEIDIFLSNNELGHHSVFINKGESSGVFKGQAVIQAGNVLLGIVDEIFSNYSKVLLMQNPDLEINVKTERGTVSLSRGKNDGMLLSFVSSGEVIELDELVFTSGLDGLPENLIVGTVSKISEPAGGLFKDVYLNLVARDVLITKSFLVFPI